MADWSGNAEVDSMRDPGPEIDAMCGRLIIIERDVIKLLKQTQKVRDEIVDITNAMAHMFPASEENPDK